MIRMQFSNQMSGESWQPQCLLIIRPGFCLWRCIGSLDVAIVESSDLHQIVHWSPVNPVLTRQWLCRQWRNQYLVTVYSCFTVLDVDPRQSWRRRLFMESALVTWMLVRWYWSLIWTWKLLYASRMRALLLLWAVAILIIWLRTWVGLILESVLPPLKSELFIYFVVFLHVE